MKQLSDTMIEFWDKGVHQRDHEAFKQWHHRRTYGQILNDDLAKPDAKLRMLGCPHVWDFSSNLDASLTKNRKICSTARGEVAKWAEQNLARQWVRCETCTTKSITKR